MGKYKFSRFFHKYIKGSQVCCYNALTMQTHYTTQSEFDNLSKVLLGEENEPVSQLLDILYSKGMIVEVAFDEMKFLKNIRKKIFNGVSIRVMVLHMTDYCNLRCKYCFIEGGQPENYNRKTMSPATAITAINKFVEIIQRNKNEKNHPSIVFYGGEPLLNWPVIKEALDYIEKVEKEKGFAIDKVIITNGTMLQKEMLETIRKHNVMISVSIDGTQEIHDANRIDNCGEGTFEKVVEKIRMLQQNGLEPTVSCVMAKEGVSNCEENVRFLVEELGIKGLGFNHVSIIPGLNYYDAQYEENFASAIIKVQELIQKEYPYVYERRMGHKVNTFIDKKLIKSDCTGCGEQISVSPEGEIGICQGYMGTRKTFVHTIFEKDYFPDEDTIFQEWSTRSPLNMEECIDCPALATCGGGCPRNADMLHGSIWKTDTAFCHFARKAQEWLVWQKIEE